MSIKKLKKQKHMENIPNDPLKKEGWYSKWHKHPQHHILQWLFLIIIVGSVGWILLDRINEPDIVSYGGNSKASNSKGNAGGHLFSGVASLHEQSPFGTSAELVDVETSEIEMGNDKIQVKLPDGPTIVMSLKNLERRGQGNVTWRGSVDGKADSSVTLSLKNGFVAGTIRTVTDLYEIRPSEGKKHVVEKMNPALFPAESDPKYVKTSSDTLSAQSTVSPTIGNDGVVQIDLLSVYTPQAKVAAGGDAQIDALIQAAVDNANTAFINSQINAHYNLVATAEVAYTESGYTGTDLPWLQSSSVVAALRDQYAADMVSLIVQNGGNACGTGYLSPTDPRYAFQVSDMDCAVGNLTFAHEHGHNLGMAHDPDNAGGSGYQAWSYGHLVTGVFRTVMSYPGTCGCTRIPYFSNPNVFYAGYSTGIADQRDNARTANVTITAISGFRGAQPPATLPATPSGLVTTSLSPSQISLKWLDNSVDELGFKIERSSDGVNFVQIAAIGANVSSYTDAGLTSSTQYYYRVKSYNSAGDSGPSNVSSATTGAPDTTPPVVTITANGVANKSLYNIAAKATDNVAVKSIQILVGGALKKTCTIKTPTANPAPCSVNLKLNSVTNGSVITAIARDTSDNISQITGVIAK